MIRLLIRRPPLIVLLALLLAMAPGNSSPARATEVLRAVAAFPPTVDYTASFLRFVAALNDRKTAVRIDYVGGPETIPQTEQAQAVGRGIVDMQYGPASHYTGLVPEGDALVGSRLSAAETRANGGLAALSAIFRQRLGVIILAHFDSGIGFHIYLRKKPPMTASGVDLSGLRLRSQPIYREFFRRLGAVPVSVPAAETYMALGRGMVDGTGWPLIGIDDLGWDKRLTVRIDPPFFQTDLLVIVNARRWDRLSAAARQALTTAAIAYEKTSFNYFQRRLPEEDRRMRDGGMAVLNLTGAARKAYLEAAYDVPWSRLKARDATHYKALEALFRGP